MQTNQLFKALEAAMISANGQDFAFKIHNTELTYEVPELSIMDSPGPYDLVRHTETFMIVRDRYFNTMKSILVGYVNHYNQFPAHGSTPNLIYSTSLNTLDSRNPGIYSVHVYGGGAGLTIPNGSVSTSWSAWDENSLDVLVDEILMLISHDNFGNADIKVNEMINRFETYTNMKANRLMATYPSTFELEYLEQGNGFF